MRILTISGRPSGTTPLFGRIVSRISSAFQKPFVGLSTVIWVYVVVCVLALPYNHVWRGELPDPDDYAYLQQTLDWLQGQGWFDAVQRRMSPPEGVVFHFTRFAQMPIAAMIQFFRFFGYSWRGAALLGAYVLPLFYLGLFFWALRRAAESFVSKDWSRLTAFAALFGTILLFKFSPAQVDHHGLLAILTVASLGMTAQAIENPAILWRSIVAGALAALSVAIGLETLPWTMFAAFIVGLWTALEGTKSGRVSVTYGASLFVTSAALLFLDRPLASVFAPDALSYSITYVLLMGGAAASLVSTYLLTSVRDRIQRIFLCAMVASMAAGIYLQNFSELLVGPYGGMNKELAVYLFSDLEEARALFERFSWAHALSLLIVPSAALYIAVAMAQRKRGAQRWAWILLSADLAGAILLATFYQARVMLYAQLFSMIPMVAFVKTGWAWIERHFKGRRRFWAEIFLIMVLGPLPAVFLPALFDGRSFNAGVLLFPAQSVDDTCDTRVATEVLDAPPYADRKLRIMNMLTEGPELLFYTPHEVMAGPYHTNVKGNLDSIRFFKTTNPDEARKIAYDDGIDVVAVCRYIPDLYFAREGVHYVTLPNGSVEMRRDDSFIAQLTMRNVPSWLKPIPLKRPTNILLFKVMRG